jgi:N-methylhydantoinase B/oxoprolinase/acetone carboxylase alpha subunit
MTKTEVKRRADGTFSESGNKSTQFKKGNNANPNGRRGALKDIIDSIGDEVDEQGRSTREEVMRKVWMMAKRGDMRAIAFIADRTEGKAREYIEQKIVQDELIVE